MRLLTRAQVAAASRMLSVRVYEYIHNLCSLRLRLTGGREEANSTRIEFTRSWETGWLETRVKVLI